MMKKSFESLAAFGTLILCLWLIAEFVLPAIAWIMESVFGAANSMLAKASNADNSGLIFVGIICFLIVLSIMRNNRNKPQTSKYITGMDDQTIVTAKLDIADPKAFDRLIGLHKAKQEVQDFFDVMNTLMVNPDLAKQYELKPPKGVLLYGPPGNGKTSFARACAKYYGFSFISVKGSELVAGDGAVGVPQQRVKTLFESARQKAPCIIFFDEIDAIAQTRSGRSINSPSDILLDSLLNEMDGFNPLRGVFLIAATNRLDILDPAITRPGRLEKHIEIGNPSLQDRVLIFRAHLGNKPTSEDIDLHALAGDTENRSGAFLEAAVNRANIVAFRERRSITQNDLVTAVQELSNSQ